MKKLFAVLLSAMAWLLCGVNASAYDFEADGLCYDILGEGYVEVANSPDYVSGLSGTLIVPETVEHDGSVYTVGGIGDYAFSDCFGLEEVVLPSTLIYIGKYSFRWCTGLRNINLPQEIYEIRKGAFMQCESLTIIELPRNLVTIEEDVFFGCTGLEYVFLPEYLYIIGDGAFYGCTGLKYVFLPEYLYWIGNSAFGYCKSLAEIVLPDGLEKIDTWAFSSCESLTSISLPASVSEIGKGAFSHCSGLTEISVSADNPYYTVADGLIYSKDKSVLHICPAGLTSAVVSDDVVEIAAYAFSGCIGLETIKLPAGLTGIGEWAFNECKSLSIIDIPEKVDTIGQEAFSYCFGLTEIRVAEGNSRYASWNGLLYSKDKSVLKACPGGLSAVDVPDGTVAIDAYAFCGCNNMLSVVLPNSLKIIGERAFSYCYGLSEVSIPNSVITIKDYAFMNTPLKKVELGSSVAEIGEYALHGFSPMDEVYCHAVTPPVAGRNAFYSIGNGIETTLYVPEGCKESYAAVKPWSDFAVINEMEGTGIEAVTVGGEVNVTVENGAIMLDPAALVEVYSPNGMLVYRGSGRVISGLPTGVYIIKVNGKTAKVAL